MANPLDLSTATTVHIGPIVDATDGVTPEPGLTTGSVDAIELWKDGATSPTDISGTTTFTHRSGGVYTVTLSASDTDTAGHLRLVVREAATCRPATRDFEVAAFADVLAAHDTTRDFIESQRDDHAQVGIGDVYYVDPTNGNDTTGDGSRTAPYATITKAHTEATDYNHDTIFLVAGNGAGQTVLDEQVTISKNYVFLRGPGQDFLLKTTSNGDLLTLSGTGVEVSGVELQTNTTGSGNGVVITGDFAQLRHCIVSRTQGDGIQVTGCEKALVENVRMFNTGQSGSGDGISIDGTSASTRFTTIRNCEVLDTQGDGISLTGGNTDDTIIRHNAIHGSTGWAISIGSGVTATVVTQNDFSNNASGDVSDSGTNSEIEKNDDWGSKAELATVDTVVDTIASDVTTIDSLVDAIKAKTDSLTFTNANEVDANVQSINDAAVSGDGSSGNKWGS